MLSAGLAEMTRLVGAQCDAEARAAVMRDYELGRSHLRFVFDVKLSGWSQLPLSMAGMTHAWSGGSH
eukprot:3208740-Alexandrium_andersonii.AAC.1